MSDNRRSVLVTGISGNLGQRLLPLLSDEYDVIGVDMRPPEDASRLKKFVSLDLGRESSCDALVELLHETKATAVIHLAFVIDPLRTGVLGEGRMWQINVAGTARVMEAIADVNRHRGGVRKFIFPSSVSAYGPETPAKVKEDYPLGAHTLPYAIHKKESDIVVRYRADQIGDCTTYLLRPHIFTGATVQNYLVGALRGMPMGKGAWGERLRQKGTRLPLMLPYGDEQLQKKFQFVHVDDMARLLAWLVRKPEQTTGEVHVLNVAGPGDLITIQECAQIGQQKLVRVPRWLAQQVLNFLWNRGASAIPPKALPYMIGSYTMDTTRLQKLLGEDYANVMQYTVTEALEDSFREPTGELPKWKTPLKPLAQSQSTQN
jgi:nucleoside-diphosphate-sugar epimerase